MVRNAFAILSLLAVLGVFTVLNGHLETVFADTSSTSSTTEIIRTGGGTTGNTWVQPLVSGTGTSGPNSTATSGEIKTETTYSSQTSGSDSGSTSVSGTSGTSGSGSSNTKETTTTSTGTSGGNTAPSSGFSGPGENTVTSSSATAPTPVQPNDAAPRILIQEGLMPPPPPAHTTQPSTEFLPTTFSSGPASESGSSKDKLQEIGSSLRDFQREVKRIEDVVRETVAREVKKARNQALQEASHTAVPAETSRAFNPEERAERIAAITNALSQDVRTTIASGDVRREDLDELEPVLKSSLADIQLLIKDETGVDVDLSPSARTVTDVVKAEAPELTRVRNELLEREGLDLYTDSDNDGISNYDEKHIYGTDPLNAFTAASSLTDGERVLLGFDPLVNVPERVPVESPQESGEEVSGVFEVHTIRVNLKPLSGPEGAATADAPPAFSESVTFAGRALPNSFVTLYIFSTPVVVTVKADVSGAWTYTLDTELEDGEHELYVATVDAGGRILAKSPSVPFVKRAEAAEFTPLLAPSVNETTPIDILQNSLTTIGIVLLIVFALIALIILGMRAANTPNGPAASA
jgi:hypothetical protein